MVRHHPSKKALAKKTLRTLSRKSKKPAVLSSLSDPSGIADLQVRAGAQCAPAFFRFYQPGKLALSHSCW
jgi:hypothetical protein